MKVSEIFYSIEGEGIEIGRPQVFIRLAGCNLQCEWCDTKYAWNNGKEMSIAEIINEIRRYPCKNISITGGEPLLQRDELVELVEKLKEVKYWIQLNTNGTIFNQKIFELVDLITMDCKCPSSEMKSDLKVLVKTKNSFGSKLQFKFVISNEEDYQYAKNVILISLKDKTSIIFQPEWNSRKFSEKLVDLVKRDNLEVRVILQQQKMIWGMKRSV